MKEQMEFLLHLSLEYLLVESGSDDFLRRRTTQGMEFVVVDVCLVRR